MKREYVLLLAGILLLSFTGCGRENPFNYADSDLSGMEKSARDENSSNKEQKNDDDENYGGSENYGDDDDYGGDDDYGDSGDDGGYGDRDDDPSESSSNKSDVPYIQKSKTLKLTLTYFEALKDWDPLSGADPIISFQIKVELDDGSIMSYDSGTLLDIDDYDKWAGTKTHSVTLPAYSRTVHVCPIVYDDEGILGTTDRNSGECYSQSDIGLLDDGGVVHQNDEYNENCIVKWEWYLH